MGNKKLIFILFGVVLVMAVALGFCFRQTSEDIKARIGTEKSIDLATYPSSICVQDDTATVTDVNSGNQRGFAAFLGESISVVSDSVKNNPFKIVASESATLTATNFKIVPVNKKYQIVVSNSNGDAVNLASNHCFNFEP
jgi:hypothetical protein